MAAPWEEIKMSFSRHLVFGVVSALILLLISVPSQSEDRPLFASELRSDISSVLGRSLLPIEDILPSLPPNVLNPPSLCVGFLKTESSDSLYWGGTIGTILRWKITYTPHVLLLSMPVSATDFRYDLCAPGEKWERLGEDLDSLARAYDVYGIRHALTGNVKISEASFQLDLHLWELPSRKEEKVFEYHGLLAVLPRTLSEASLAILEAVGVTLADDSKKYVSALTPDTYEQLRKFVEVWTAADQGQEEGVYEVREALWNDARNLPMLSLPYCHSLADHQPELAGDYVVRLRGILERFPDHTGVQGVVAKFLPTEDNPQISKEKLELRRLAALESPMDAQALGALAEGLYEEERNLLDSVSVITAALERFPRNYRFWWSLAYILNRAAADTRGSSMYGDINPDDREQFPLLNAKAALAVERGLQINPNSVGLWHMRMRVIGIEMGANQEFMEAFDRVIQIDPQYQAAYRTAFNYIGSEWGGTIQDQIKVIQAVVRNIPQDEWLLSRLIHQTNSDIEEIEETPGQSAQDLVHWVKELREPAVLLGVKMKSMNYLLYCYRMFLRMGDRENGVAVFNTMYKSFREGRHTIGPRELHRVEELLSLGDPVAASTTLSLMDQRLSPKIRPCEDDMISLYALVSARQGKLDDSLRRLTERIHASPENQFSRLRYLELGVDFPLDPQVRSECVADLCPSASHEVDYRAKYGRYDRMVPPDPDSPRIKGLTGDYLKILASGHVAMAEKDPNKALNYYLQAAFVSKHINNTSLDAPFPSYFVHVWRTYRTLAQEQ